MKIAAIYTRVSSDQQRENKTIDSQVDELLDFAEKQGYAVPAEYVFKDEGYSGAILVRPGLEKVRDLSAEGQIQAVLIYSPDRLSRNYAYQVVLMDEFASCGTEVLFVSSPKADTPEQALLLQFQGMIAEYERAQIKERSRRGKRFKAKSGVVSVLCGAPYGYNYIKKTDDTAAYYQINKAEALIVKEIFRMYTEDFCGIGAIARKLTAEKIPTRKRVSRWERSVIWAMLRNPAYSGKACYGKTERAERQKVTKPLRAKGGYVAKNGCNREKPREEWIEIPVSPIVTQATFDIAQERLKTNKLHSRRNTHIETLLQGGMMVCSECGYSLYRTWTTTSAKNKIYYYRCFGSDQYRFEGGRKCTCKPLRQDYIDKIVWDQIVVLLQDPKLIQREVEKRVEESRKASPAIRQKTVIEKQKAKITQSMDKLLDAYQEGLIPITQLRKRMPELQKRINTTEKELENLRAHELALDQRLQLLDVPTFKTQLSQNLDNLDIKEKKKILRLLVKEVVVGDDVLEIKHSIPLKEAKDENDKKSYQLCTRSAFTAVVKYRPGRIGQGAGESGAQVCPLRGRL
jgi:site-specific DNA recombinase